MSKKITAECFLWSSCSRVKRWSLMMLYIVLLCDRNPAWCTGRIFLSFNSVVNRIDRIKSKESTCILYIRCTSSHLRGERSSNNQRKTNLSHFVGNFSTFIRRCWSCRERKKENKDKLFYADEHFMFVTCEMNERETITWTNSYYLFLSNNGGVCTVSWIYQIFLHQ